MVGAFEGVRVVDATRDRPGALAAMLLADFGADVLKVVDTSRTPGVDPTAGVGWDRNKHRLDLDLGSGDGATRLEALLLAADVFVFDRGPRACAERGFDGVALSRRHPRLIPLWTPPVGTEGPWSEMSAHHGALMGLSGAAFRQGGWGHGPIWHVTPIAHYAQAVLAATAVGAALLARDRDGHGQPVTVSGLHALAQVACPVTELGGAGFGRGSPTGDSPSYRLYRCGDGKWLFLGALFSHFFARASEALGLKGADLHDAGAAIAGRLESGTRDHWLEVLRAHDVPAGPVERRDDWLASEICEANGLCATLDDEVLGPVTAPGVVARLLATPGSVRHPLRPASEPWLSDFLAARPEPDPASEGEPAPPLAGVEVLDLGTVIAGAYAGAILANLGAQVVKIESADGDPFRFAMTGFINYNRGKRGLGLDLKAPAGRAAFLDMCAGADIVLDNYRLGVRERLGIDHDAVRAVNPRLISASLNTYGARGRHAALPGFDPLIQAESGLMTAQGGDGPPVFHTIPVNDVATAAVTAFALVAALNARARTGQGQTVETSLAASSTLYQFAELVHHAGRAAAPVGCRDCPGFTALDRYHACADGWITLAVSETRQFAALAAALGRPDWPARWSPDEAMAEARDGRLAQEIAAEFAGRSREAVLDALAAAGVPCAPVLTQREAGACEALWRNGYYQIFAHPRWGELVGSRGYARFGEAPAQFDRLEPDLGEHSVEVLLDHGFDRDRIIALARAGVIFRG